MPSPTMTLRDNRTGDTVDLAIQEGTLGTPVVDIGNLAREFGSYAYDPGFLSTASCKSDITYLDGTKGELLYRGYPIEQLAERCNFLEVCYLILNGDLPNSRQKAEFEHTISIHTMINESLRRFFDGFRYDAHPMAMMTGVVG